MAIGIIVGLVAGKTVGIFGATYLMARFTRARLDEDRRWVDVAGLAVLAWIGFTVSLLTGDLAYGPDSARGEHVKVGVLVGSLTAAVIAAVILRFATAPTGGSVRPKRSTPTRTAPPTSTRWTRAGQRPRNAPG